MFGQRVCLQEMIADRFLQQQRGDWRRVQPNTAGRIALGIEIDQ